jgi:squalene-hopene/tetraprenyl-beta-curcumene cyclase
MPLLSRLPMTRATLNRRSAVRCSIAILALAILTVDARADDPDVDVKATINRGLSFLAKDSRAWKESKKCYECHHTPFTIWALNEGKKQGYAVDEDVLADLTSWVLGDDFLAQLIKERPADKEVVFNEAPLLLALGIEAGSTNDKQNGLKKLLTSVVNDQGQDGSWKRVNEARPILSSPDTLTMLVLLVLSAPDAPDMGNEGKTAQQRALQFLQTARPDDELQPTVLRLILWRRLGRPDSEWKPLDEQLRSVQNEDGGWSQIKSAKSDAYATGQALYALAEAGATKNDAAIRRAQSFLEKSQRPDGAWAMTSRAIMGNGKVATKFEPITHAASAWAVMGLVRSAPAETRAGSAASP